MDNVMIISAILGLGVVLYIVFFIAMIVLFSRFD